MIKYLQITEVLTGLVLLLVAILAHLNTVFCITNKGSCGMMEQIISLWGILFGSALLVSGMCLGYSGKKRWLGHLLFAFIVFFAVTID